ncbi:ABC transporter ATP-binding protein [Streptomyces thermolilacinus]|uniref:ABC transporter n=1 Tax=Streptomyces thermolilacinus SPC6 TaxID=1306406 RepID=A0A1D3DP15_9ACTN|nr:ABC transporter ATP-binding protein [Streptomyces thermolilacinus]OEJ94067.1 ABC transporter [Streptomyces thermolilacinus SPC6]
MLQAIGLTSTPRRNRPPAVDDLTFDARPGQVTALLGPAGAGKTTALRLLLGLEQGRGITYFRGRPLHRVAHPMREVGVLLGDVPGHPARTVRGQLRMLCAAAGVPASRADDLIDAVGLEALAGHRLGTLSRGMDRRLGVAVALLGDPHTLILDEPAAGLSRHEAAWLYGVLRAHADEGGTVLYATSDTKTAARTADHVVAIRSGRLVADQDAADFARTRLRPRVAVRTPHAARLAAQLTREARAARRSVETVTERGNRLYVYGSDCAEVGETAFRHGILLHRLAEETGPAPDAAPHPRPQEAAPEPLAPVVDRASAPPTTAPAPLPTSPATPDHRAAPHAPATPDDPATPHHPTPPNHPTTPHRPAALGRPTHRAPRWRGRRARRGPSRPLRYELRRLMGVPSTAVVLGGAVAGSALLAVLLGRSAGTPTPVAVAAWPELLPLPPAALGAGLIGAFSFGDEYRHPALPVSLGAAPRRLGLLLAKLAVTAVIALLLAVAVAVVDLEVLRLVYGGALIPVPGNWPTLCAGWLALVVGCAWAGLLAAGVFRAAAAGIAAVLAVPVVIAPAVEEALLGPAVRTIAGLPARLRELAWPRWPHEADRWIEGALRVLAQPVGAALALSLAALLCAFLLTGLRRDARW